MDIEIKLNGVHEKRISLALGEHLVGRSEDCQIILSEKRVSRKHAKIIVSNNRWYIEDLANINGTFVNDKKITGKNSLKDTDVVRIGSYTLSRVQEAKIKRLQQRLALFYERLLAVLGSRPLLVPIAFVVGTSLVTLILVSRLNGLYLTEFHFQSEKERARLLVAALAATNRVSIMQTDV